MINTMRKNLFKSIFISLVLLSTTNVYAVEPVINKFIATPNSCSSTCLSKIEWDVSGADNVLVEYLKSGTGTWKTVTTSTNQFSGSGEEWADPGTNTFRIKVNGDDKVQEAPVTVTSGNASANSSNSTPTPTVTPIYRQCNETCGGANQQCGAGLQCISISGQYLCRHPSVPSRGDCSTTGGNTSGTSSPTATPTPINSTGSSGSTGGTTTGGTAGTGSVLGAATTASPTPTGSAISLGQSVSPTPEGEVLGISETKNTKSSSPLSIISNGLRGLQEAIYKAIPAARSNPLVGMVVALAGLGVIGAVGFGIYQYTQDMTGDKLRKTIQKMKSDS